MPIESCQNLIIGSGVAGKVLSWSLGKMGQKTIVVERSMIGGACPNIACLPSKNVVYSAKAIALVDPVRGLGVVTGSPKVDMPAVIRDSYQYFTQSEVDRLQRAGYNGGFTALEEAVGLYVKGYLDSPDRYR